MSWKTLTGEECLTHDPELEVGHSGSDEVVQSTTLGFSVSSEPLSEQLLSSVALDILSVPYIATAHTYLPCSGSEKRSQMHCIWAFGQ